MRRTLTILGLVGLAAGGSLTAQVVESPTTVARGAWLVEADIAAATWDTAHATGSKVHTHDVGVAVLMISTGVTDKLDVQFGFDGWLHAEEKHGGGRDRSSGWGDAWVRAKWNFYGDEATGPAWAVLPYVKIPVGHDDIGNSEWEGGLALIYGQPLDEDDWIEAFVSGDSLHSEVRGRDEQLVGGVVWGRNVTERTTVYTELLVEWLSAADGDVPLIWGVGVSPVIQEGFALDFEVLAGLTDEATDWALAVRLVWEL